MIKIVMTWKHNPRLTPEQCDEHYVTRHTELALESIKRSTGMLAYVQNRVVDCRWNDYNDPVSHPGAPDFDRYVELYYEDVDAMEAAGAGADMTAIFADHPNFMDTQIPGSLRTYVVEETVVSGSRTLG